MHRLIKELVLASYTNGNLDPKRVERVTRLLNRTLLKKYIKALKNKETFNSVSVDSSYELDERDKKEFETVFPKKNLTFNIDPSMISGVKITNGDIIYEMSVRGALDQILEKIREDYD